MKFIFALFIFCLLNNCSLNQDSAYWTEESINFKNEDIKKKDIQKKLPKILEKSDDITTMSLEEYKIYIDDYIKKSKYPDISQ
jgi:hypothetical protein